MFPLAFMDFPIYFLLFPLSSSCLLWNVFLSFLCIFDERDETFSAPFMRGIKLHNLKEQRKEKNLKLEKFEARHEEDIASLMEETLRVYDHSEIFSEFFIVFLSRRSERWKFLLFFFGVNGRFAAKWKKVSGEKFLIEISNNICSYGRWKQMKICNGFSWGVKV